MARPSGHDTTTDARRSHSSRPFPRTEPPRASETSHGAMSGAMVPKSSSFPDLGDSDGRLRGNDGNGNHPQNNRAAAASLAPRRRDEDEGQGWELQRLSWARAIGVFWVYAGWLILDLVAL